MATKISLKDLLEAGAHFGHQAKRWNPKMKPYLFGVRNGVHIFDLVKTKEGLEKAAAFVRDLTSKGGLIVFVGTKRQAAEIVKEEAKKAGKKLRTDFKNTGRNRMMYITFTFTHFRKIKSDDSGEIILENDLSVIQEFPSYIDVIIR